MTRTTLARPGTAWLLGGALLAAMSGAPQAGQTPAQKCSVAKSRAAEKKIAAKLKCQQRAVQAGTGVDSGCLTTAEAKFDQAIAKAEAAGGCAVNGDGATIEAAVDSCVESIVTLTPGTSQQGCCSFRAPISGTVFPGCTMDLAQCSNLNGTVVSGVCRNDGTCGTATGPGECCNFVPGGCFVLNAPATFTQTACSLVDGTFAGGTVCTAQGCL
jgi:hypothetical protein